MRYGWSLDTEHWNGVDHILGSSGWSACKFTRDSLDLVPKSRRVYMLVASPPVSNFSQKNEMADGLAAPVYVGIAIDLSRRFKQHISFRDGSVADRIKPLLQRTRFWFLEMPETQEELRRIEQILIDAFGPTANKINSVVKKDREIIGKI